MIYTDIAVHLQMDDVFSIISSKWFGQDWNLALLTQKTGDPFLTPLYLSRRRMFQLQALEMALTEAVPAQLPGFSACCRSFPVLTWIHGLPTQGPFGSEKFLESLTLLFACTCVFLSLTYLGDLGVQVKCTLSWWEEIIIMAWKTAILVYIGFDSNARITLS